MEGGAQDAMIQSDIPVMLDALGLLGNNHK